MLERPRYGRRVPSQPFLRFPSVRGEALAFVADDDVWLSSADGGPGRRLTVDRAPVAFPRFSPDGHLVAFTSRRDGPPEVYVVSVDGGDERRVTYFGDLFTWTLGWTADGRILATSAVGQPFRSRTWAYALPPDGGAPERLGYGPVTAVATGEAGLVVLGVNQNRRRGASWKRYRGGTAASLWIDEHGSGTFTRFLTELNGQLEDPSVIAGRVVFLSDHEGVSNVYSVLPDGSELRRHSDHGEFYARAASSDGRRLVYQNAGTIYRLDALAADSEPIALEIRLDAPRSGRARRQLKAEDELGSFSVDREGRASAAELRGEVHWLTHEKGPARRLAGGDGVRTRLARVATGDGVRLILCVSDADGVDSIEVLSPDEPPGEPRRIGAGELGRVLDLAVAPDGSRAAVATHDGRVVLVELADGRLVDIDRTDFGDADGLTFSPDSSTLAWSHPGPQPLRQIKLFRDGEVFELTPLRFHDSEPAFSLDGKYLAFLSSRTFDPLYDEQVFDMSFAAGTRPYLVPLAAGTPSPFDPEIAGRRRPEAHESFLPEPSTVDRDGLAERVVSFPVRAGRYSHLSPVGGAFVYLSRPLTGVLGEGRAILTGEAARPSLLRLDLATGEETELVASLDAYEASGDGRFVVVRDKKALRLVPSDRRATPEEPDPRRRPVEIDLSRARVEISPPLEWAQMYAEAARLMRDMFWIADMGGVDWEGVVERYRPLLDRIATRDDLSELLWEVQGELGSSHAYEAPPERPVESERRLGLLGADVERVEDGWRVARILPGESSVPAARSPLRAPAVDVSVGDVLLAVDGSPVGDDGPSARMVGAADKPVELTVRRAATGEVRQVVVEPIGDERPLRYQAWVADRRAAVHAASDGRVGYLHIPDMVASGWAELHRDMRLEVDRDGLIVDVRDNSGGHVSELVLEKIGRVVTAWDVVRHNRPRTYPSHSPRGPRVMVTNEQAGSDGDIVTAGFRLRGLGPVVGMRTWGGVIGIDGRFKLVDGTVVTQPRYSFWFYGLGFGVENYGVDPDVVVPFPPQDWRDGRDPQLEKAIELVLAALSETPPAMPPDPSTRPSRAAPPLPPRPGVTR